MSDLRARFNQMRFREKIEQSRLSRPDADAMLALAEEAIADGERLALLEQWALDRGVELHDMRPHPYVGVTVNPAPESDSEEDGWTTDDMMFTAAPTLREAIDAIAEVRASPTTGEHTRDG